MTKHFATDHHGWLELLSVEPPERPVFTGTRRVPWAVVGAGFTGLAAARRLAELHSDDDILLLDARRIGQGASGRNSGFAVATSHFGGAVGADRYAHCRRVNRINRAGLDVLDALVERFQIDCQWRRDGFYHAAADRAALRECEHFAGYLERLEIEYERLDGEALAAHLGTGWYRAGVRVVDGALIQPAALVLGLAASLPENVSLHEQSAVLDIDAGELSRLRLTGGEVVADRVILATNYEATRLGFLRGRITASTLAGSFTRVLTADERASLGSESDWGLLSLHGGGATLRLTVDGRISLRNTAEYRGEKLLEDATLARRQAVHRDAFERRFPQLRHVEFEFGWSGVEGVSRNATNFFGRQHERIYLAGGYNGSGVSRGTAFGIAIADYASGEDSGLVADCLASPPAAWIPPSPLRDIGAFFTVRRRYRGVGRDR